ncbi:MAG: hypothetical protein K0Q59_5984 [Paenibacillus sp.]|jgi:hypothetical protein|nr:hypothetical protein [Paenibacillus sp.]
MDELIAKIDAMDGIQVELRAVLVEIVQSLRDAASSYDNTESGLEATTVQGAIDELAAAAAGG